AAADGRVHYEDAGSMLLAETPEEAAELELAARAMDAEGLPICYHARDPLRRGYYAAIEQPGDAAVHPVELAQAVFRASGAELVANNEAYKLEPIADRVAVHTRRFIFHARHVMICTNAYSCALHPYFIDKIIPTRGQCLVTAPIPDHDPLPINTCGYSDYGYLYYRMTFDRRLLIGGGRNRHFALEHDTFDDRATAPVQGTLDAYLRMRFPDVTAPVDRRWAGIMGFSAGRCCRLAGRLPGMPNVGFAVGFTGHGLSMGASTAERAVEHLLTGAPLGVLDAARLEA
ncbi:MAG: FAD-binding oxidoreductase, partial [Blastochloris sp.]|nr:FAD-binding oxidoreductase [Blastochloris sp.]